MICTLLCFGAIPAYIDASRQTQLKSVVSDLNVPVA